MLKNNFSEKAVSKLLGHATEIITVDIYGDNINILPEEIPELLEYMKEVLPDDETDDETPIDAIVDTTDYLSNVILRSDMTTP